ncbi:catalase family peroxidase [Rheinheimera maricola]|uniref:Catalase-related peroxidase n=1 Tax=Rheinheimera maricola TaxID=2793282 RepID=A0ABS7X954_9GAMM|nr:catalase family peroxidase [Rheinheimera maricola]MBZ9611147.1 catalase family peroxidase [Rheinheimera maricola]
MKQLYLALLLLPAIGGLHAEASDKVSAQQFVDLQQGKTAFAGFRRAHAKGLCVSGEFRSNGNLQSYSKASLFQPGTTPLVGRLSIAGNNPAAPDLKAPVRSLALSFSLSRTEQWRLAMNTPPVMAVADPHSFYQQIQAIQAGPDAIKQFFAQHPESSEFLTWAGQYQPTGSFAAETYNSINAFYLVNAKGEPQAVRWAMQPTVSVAPGNLQGDNALQQEIATRIAADQVVFDWVFTLADATDDETNSTKAWPASRQQITAGQIVLTGSTAQLDGDCHAINFDPLVLPTGITATADPILRARSAAYAESYRRRAKEQRQGALQESSNE